MQVKIFTNYQKKSQLTKTLILIKWILEPITYEEITI